MVGWILIEDTNIDYPVMQTPADPNYYLKHDFERNYTDYGCPFMQADCDAISCCVSCFLTAARSL